ncbi:helix-turn-helix domain-containing protein [Salinibacterium sp. NYA9b]
MAPQIGSEAPILREVAEDISALHDPDLILTGLVRRVRSAVGCELAYLSLNESATRTTEIQFSDGILTPEYAAIRMPIGTGVLGMAAAGFMTESADYLRDVSRLHIESVDEAVTSEGVRAILSTPLRAGGDVVGALTVANRTAGAFTQRQKETLVEAALIGSIAVDVYNLRRRLETQTETSKREIESLLSSSEVETIQLRASDQFSAALAAGQGTVELLEIASTVVRGRVTIGDSDEGSSLADSATSIPLDAGGAIQVSDADPRLIQALAPTMATFISISLLYERAIENARHFRESEVVERVIEPARDGSGPSVRLGLPGTGSVEVTVIAIEDPNARRAALASLRKGMGRDAIAAERRGSIIVIVRSLPSRAERLSECVGSFTYFGGIAAAVSEADIPTAYAEAARLARSMRALHRPRELAAKASLGVVAFAVGGSGESAELYVADQLGPLMGGTSRDERLLETALRYLDTQGSVSGVASSLSIHENTVRQRMERLDQLLPGWREGPRSLDVHIALRTHAVLDAG